MTTSHAPSRRRTRRFIACLGVIVLTSAGAVASASGAAKGATSVRFGYAIDRPLCPTKAKPHHMTCFAMRRLDVKKGTPGAYRYRRSIGLGPAGGYTPDDLAVTYNYNPNTNRASQTVGIVDWYDDANIATDLATFDANYGLPAETATSFRKVNQTGKKSPLPSSTQGKSSSGEIALDVESVRGVCHTCRILLVEAKTPSDSDIATAENTAVRLGATEVTNSFGEPEAGGKPAASVLNAYNHPGVVITASTGDDGWFGWDFANNGTPPDLSQDSPDFPSTAPTVIAVGGVQTLVNNDATISDQSVWNENGSEDGDGFSVGRQGAGGGGCSIRYQAPPWQAALAGYVAAGCAGKRLAADVSELADPQTGFDVYNSWGGPGWYTLGGTSLASPIVAAMYALAGGSGGAVYPAASLYQNALDTPSDVYDVTEGGNSFCGGATTSQCGFDVNGAFGTHNPNALGGGNVDCSFPHNLTDPPSPPDLSSECNAVVGYDGPTGFGTPNGVGLFTSTSPTVSLQAPKRPRLHKSAAFSATAHSRLVGAHITSYAFGWGDGQNTSGSASKAHHTYKKPGTYSVRLIVTDSEGQQSVATKVITIGKPLHVRISGPSSVKRGHRGKFKALASDPNTGGKVSKVRWSWGDHKSAKGAKASHVWHKAGHFTVVITVTDNTGVTTTKKRKLKVT